MGSGTMQENSFQALQHHWGRSRRAGAGSGRGAGADRPGATNGKIGYDGKEAQTTVRQAAIATRLHFEMGRSARVRFAAKENAMTQSRLWLLLAAVLGVSLAACAQSADPSSQFRRP
jgi:hypothetical protein